MYILVQSPEFAAWLGHVPDRMGKAKILRRMLNAEVGNFGDCGPVGGGISEMRIDYGPGYRVYFKRSGATIYVLLCGGDKSSQKRDIARARRIAGELK